MRVAVIGGGVSGFSCATQILEHFRSLSSSVDAVAVDMISDAFSPNTTGDGSAGLWGPYLLGATSTTNVHRWSKVMHDFLEQLWLSEDAGEAGVCLIPVVRVSTTAAGVEDFWQDIVYGCVPLQQKQLDALDLGRQKKFTAGLHFVTYTSEPVKLLPYLMKRFQASGGQIIQRKVDDLNEFVENSQYDAVINCTGLGSREMIKDDQMYAVRGQVSRVRAGWLYYGLLDESDDGNYIIPNTDSVVLGGTHQEQDYNTTPTTQDQQFILQGCRGLVPGLKHAQHLFDWVGLRPGRNELRLETDKQGHKIVIHNYGHGGSGVTMAWGCAADVLELLQVELQKRKSTKSKL